MTLNDWFNFEEKRTGKRPSNAAFGREIGMTGQGVGKLLDGSIPKPDKMPLIEKATRGKVKAADFYS